jgi:hypothetical protein
MDEIASNFQNITERRRGVRFPVIVPVEAKWIEPNGKSFKEPAQARQVNVLGGLLEMKTYPAIGTQLELTNLLSGDKARARAIAVRRTREGQIREVAVELIVASESFWGLNFQLKKTSSELVKLEQAIKSGGLDPRILMEFRDAVDYVRKTAWAVQEWQERQLQQHDPHTVLPLLTAERIRRGIQLSNSIAGDLASHEVTRDTPGIEDLFQAIGRIYQSLTDLFKDRKK